MAARPPGPRTTRPSGCLLSAYLVSSWALKTSTKDTRNPTPTGILASPCGYFWNCASRLGQSNPRARKHQNNPPVVRTRTLLVPVFYFLVSCSPFHFTCIPWPRPLHLSDKCFAAELHFRPAFFSIYCAQTIGWVLCTLVSFRTVITETQPSCLIVQ